MPKLKQAGLVALLVWAFGACAPLIAHAALPEAMALAPAGGEPAACLEVDLDQAWPEARWPADIAALSNAQLQHCANTAQARGLVQLRDAARHTAELLQRLDIRLFRASFQALDAAAPGAAAEQAADLRKAALGDAEAAWRLAQRLPADAPRRRGWLQLSAALGNAHAAYELALNYRREQQPMMAALHEAQALRLGHTTPVSLDHARK